jgi:hypothetical protein
LLPKTLKRFVLVILLLISLATAKAQSGDTYSAFSIGVGVGTTAVYDYVLAPQNKYAYSGTLNYNITPFFTLTGEAQVGKFEGGDLTAFNMKYFRSTYASLLLHADLQLGELIDYSRSDLLYALKDLYFGSGFGFLKNQIDSVQKVFPNSGGTSFYNTTSGNTNLVIPLIIGYDFKIYNAYDQPQIRLNVSYASNAVFGQGIDGYVTAAPIKFYGYLSVGVKFGFGYAKLYNRPLRY